MTARIVLEADPSFDHRAAILAPLAAYNTERVGPGLWGTVALTVRDEQDAIVGGLWGHHGYGFLFIELLCAGPDRHAGIGTALMARAEAECRRLGLVGIWLDTWTFQAPDFYRRLGFTECGRIPCYPPGHDRVFFHKRLD